MASTHWETDDGEASDSVVGARVVLGVRSWALETACLSTVGTFTAGLVARDDELKERELTGLGNEAALADKEVPGLLTAESAGVYPLILFCGSERGDGL